jgi:hypothetical protein
VLTQDGWVYHVKENRWEKLTPKPAGKGKAPQFLDNRPSGYDERHNAVVFTDYSQGPSVAKLPSARVSAQTCWANELARASTST